MVHVVTNGPVESLAARPQCSNHVSHMLTATADRKWTWNTIRLAAVSTCRRERTLTNSTQQRPCSQADSSPASTKISAYYASRRFNTLFVESRHSSLSWARSIKSTPSQPISLLSILSTYLRPGLPSDFLPSGMSTKILYALLCHTC
jgi:hypothetical protein